MRYESKNENCTKCGEFKTGSYVKESWCSKCIGERRKERVRLKRIERDLPPHGSGRDPKCKTCRTIKEAPYVNGSLCRKCKLISEKERYANKIASEDKAPRRSGRNPVCKCGAIKEQIKEAYCNVCMAARKRKYCHKNMHDPLFKLKLAARQAVKRYLALGRIEKQVCEVCGEINTEAHHDDYMKPLDIRWLCRKHHMEHHKNEKEKQNV